MMIVEIGNPPSLQKDRNVIRLTSRASILKHDWPTTLQLFFKRMIVFGDQIFCDNSSSGSAGGGTITRLPEVFTKCPTGTLPQLHRPPWVSLVELVWLVVLLAMVPRIALPESPLSCKDAAMQFQANNKKIKPNINKSLISYLLKTTILWLNK
jgi:hypothetical protein